MIKYFQSKVPNAPLCLAAKEGNFAQLKALLTSGTCLVNERDQNGKTPLHWAAEKQNLKLVEYLLDNGSDITITTSKRGQVAPHYAAYTGNIEILKVMVQKRGKEILTLGSSGRCTVHKCLVRICFWDINPKFQSFHFACRKGHLELVMWMVSQGVEFNASDKWGNYPVHDTAGY